MSTQQHPAAWAVLADNGNVRLWSTDHAEVRAFAEGIGQPLIALYPGPPAQPAPHDDPIGNACRLLRDAAQEYAEGVSVNGVPDWKNEPDTHSAYIEHITAAHRLEQWAASIGAGGVEPLRRRECLHQIAEPAAVAVPGWKLLPIDPTLELLCATMSDGEEDAARGFPQEHMQLLLERAGIRARYARILAAAPTANAAPVAQGDAEQRQMDAKHAEIYRWLLGNLSIAGAILDNWCDDAEADIDELHDAFASAAASSQAKEGGAA